MTRTIRITTWTVAAILVASVLGCSAHNDPVKTGATSPSTPSLSGTGTPSVTSSPSPTSTAGAGTSARATSIAGIEREVLDAYLGMQQAFEKAGEIPDPSYPDLPRYTTGPALQLLTKGLTSMKTQGLRSRGQTLFYPKVHELAPAKAPTKARVYDCIDTRKAVAYKANGDPYKDTPGGWRFVVADLESTTGTWKVTGLGIYKVGSCTG